MTAPISFKEITCLAVNTFVLMEITAACHAVTETDDDVKDRARRVPMLPLPSAASASGEPPESKSTALSPSNSISSPKVASITFVDLLLALPVNGKNFNLLGRLALRLSGIAVQLQCIALLFSSSLVLVLMDELPF